MDNLTPADITEIFNEIDTDKNGFLSSAERGAVKAQIEDEAQVSRAIFTGTFLLVMGAMSVGAVYFDQKVCPEKDWCDQDGRR